MTKPLDIAFIGNFGPMCTEWETREGFRNLGHSVTSYQENDVALWDELIEDVNLFDLILWTRTRSYAELAGAERQWKLATVAARHKVPIVGIHADLWWGLKRVRELTEDPYFQVIDVFFSADGAHNNEFANLGIMNYWCLPAIAESRTGKGQPREEFKNEIAFVGSWDGGYHKEAERHALIAWLDKEFGSRVRFWPGLGQGRIWGDDLSDLYASVKLAVGDSANIGGAGYYCSDRIPNTLGRGCMLAHPYVKGVMGTGEPFDHPALVPWPEGNWKEAAEIIEATLSIPTAVVDELTDDAVEFIRKNHTWTVRAQQILDKLTETYWT